LGEPPRDRSRWLRCDAGDLRQVGAALERSGAEGVVHLAARSSVAASHAEPLETYRANVAGTLAVLEAAREARFEGPLLLVGSGEVYGRCGSGPSREDAPLAPLSAYAGTKAAQEMIGGQYARTYGLRVVLTRSFAHTGPRQDGRFVFPSLARQLARIERTGGDGVLRVGNLQPVRDYLDVRDVVRAYALLLERGTAGAVLNVCSGRGFRLSDLVYELVEIAAVRVTIEEDPARLRGVDLERLVGDPARLTSLGWLPGITHHQMLSDLYRYWRERTWQES
ncbi:MAG: GDP-mannose 4,6-dehydratase, partial [Gemmatimonadetes bacterium]|nr:GDP-mannose 4,6-dehydratase [Gemmatimonadota bacterium]